MKVSFHNYNEQNHSYQAFCLSGFLIILFCIFCCIGFQKAFAGANDINQFCQTFAFGKDKNTPLYLGDDTLICGQSSYNLHAGKPFDIYKWSTGEITESIEVTTSGNYSLMAGILDKNLILNGDFESGNASFTSELMFDSKEQMRLVLEPNRYAVTNAMNKNANYAPCPSTEAKGNMLVSLGQSGLSNVIWRQISTVKKNSDYYFTFWISYGETDKQNINVNVQINGVPLMLEKNFQTKSCSWMKFSGIWNSKSSKNAIIEIRQSGTEEGVVAIDNIHFSKISTYYDSIHVTIDPIYVNAGPDLSSCSNDLEIITALCNDPEATFVWNTGEVGPTIVPDTTGIYVLKVSSKNGCTSIDSVFVDVVKVNWKISKIQSTPTYCDGSYGTVSVETEGDFDDFPYYTWTGPGPYSSNDHNSRVWRNLDSGIYFVTIRSGFCYHFDSVVVHVEGPPVASFVPDVKSGKAPLTVHFQNTTVNGNLYIWDFGTGKILETTDLSTETIVFDKPGNYKVKLIAKRPGCGDSETSVNIDVQRPK